MSTGRWSSMAAGPEPRNYHSVAVLLPDGRVFSGGGGLCGTCATNHPDGQIFSPPYFFNSNGSLRTRPSDHFRPVLGPNRADDQRDDQRAGHELCADAVRRGDAHGRQRSAAHPAHDRLVERQHLQADDPVRPRDRAPWAVHVVRAQLRRHAERRADDVHQDAPLRLRPDAFGKAVVGDRTCDLLAAQRRGRLDDRRRPVRQPQQRQRERLGHHVSGRRARSKDRPVTA